jgi:hypothetical protein
MTYTYIITYRIILFWGRKLLWTRVKLWDWLKWKSCQPALHQSLASCEGSCTYRREFARGAKEVVCADPERWLIIYIAEWGAWSIIWNYAGSAGYAILFNYKHIWARVHFIVYDHSYWRSIGNVFETCRLYLWIRCLLALLEALSVYSVIRFGWNFILAIPTTMLHSKKRTWVTSVVGREDNVTFSSNDWQTNSLISMKLGYKHVTASALSHSLDFKIIWPPSEVCIKKKELSQ